MKRCLILLTSNFPYSHGETFLESEIGHLAKHFDKVLIFASDLSSDDKQTRRLPEGVICRNVAKHSSMRLARLGDTVLGALRVPFSTEVGKLDRTDIGHSPSKKAFLEYFEKRSRRQFGEICSALSEYDLTDCDEILIYSYWFFAMARIGCLLKEKLSAQLPSAKVLLVSRAHRYDLYEYANSMKYLPLRSEMLRRLDMLYPCSENGTSYIKAKLPEFSSKIKTSFLGTFDCGVAPPSSDGVMRIVSCSYVKPVKRIERLVTSLSLLRDSGIAVHWTHIGGGESIAPLKKLAHDKLDFMEFELLDNIDNTSVYKFYRSNPVDLFINVSASEGLPISIMEAISFGIPCVATDVGGTSEIVSDRKNGFLISKNFADNELADLIASYNKLSAQAKDAYRLSARNSWCEHFNAEENYEKFCKELTNLFVTV